MLASERLKTALRMIKASAVDHVDELRAYADRERNRLRGDADPDGTVKELLDQISRTRLHLDRIEAVLATSGGE